MLTSEKDTRHALFLAQVSIPAADLTRIFERFHRARNVGAISGAGIGLATIRDVAEQHGGSITEEIRERRGSTFTIRLPVSSGCSRPGRLNTELQRIEARSDDPPPDAEDPDHFLPPVRPERGGTS